MVADLSNANVNHKRAAKTRNKLEMEIEDEPEVKKIMLKRQSLSKILIFALMRNLYYFVTFHHYGTIPLNEKTFN